MMRSFVKVYFGVIAAAAIAMLATTASANTGNLLANGDVELESRFVPHGTPGVDSANGFADSWHHSGGATWNPPLDGMYTSGVHSLYLLDTSTGGHEEHRSFVEDLSSGFGIVSGVIPDVGLEGRSLWLNWKWKWNKGAGDLFSATVRTSTQPPNGLDLRGNNDNGVQIRDHLYLTDGSADSDGFRMFMESIPLLATEQTFDVIFRSRDNTGDASEMGKMWIDDICVNYHVPEPATMGLLGLGGLGLMMVSRRRRG